MGGKAAIILVIGFGIILGKIAFNMNDLETKAVDNVSYYLDNTTAHNLALAGANAALSITYQNPSMRGIVTDPGQYTTGPFAGGQYTARLDSINIAQLRLRTVSSYKNLHDTVDVTFKPLLENPFSLYAWMTNFEGNIFWVTEDTVWGRVHSNGILHVNGSPVFWQKATTVKQFDPRPGTGVNKAEFKDGYETGVAPIPFPTDISLLINASSSASGGRNYTSEVWVTLSPGTSANGDGMVYVRNSATGPIVDSVSLSDPTFNGALVGTQRVHVQGTLDGKLTIGSLQDLYVEDNILYERNPLSGSSDDLLGLVAEANVIIADNAANNDNCAIDAAIFSRSGSFTVENLTSRPVSGELQVIGSIVQYTRAEVGRYSGPHLHSGFSKRYRYDPRLADPSFRPPYFPGYYTHTLQISGWWESFRLPRF